MRDRNPIVRRPNLHNHVEAAHQRVHDLQFHRHAVQMREAAAEREILERLFLAHELAVVGLRQRDLPELIGAFSQRMVQITHTELVVVTVWAPQSASVNATKGEMSTDEFFRDHAHASPSGRFAAPFNAERNSGVPR